MSSCCACIHVPPAVCMWFDSTGACHVYVMHACMYVCTACPARLSLHCTALTSAWMGMYHSRTPACMCILIRLFKRMKSFYGCNFHYASCLLSISCWSLVVLAASCQPGVLNRASTYVYVRVPFTYMSHICIRTSACVCQALSSSALHAVVYIDGCCALIARH